MTVDAQGLRTSKDEGKTWSEPQPVCKGINPKEPASFYLLRAGNGALVIVYLDLSDDHFSWDDAAGEPKPDCRCEFWAIRRRGSTGSGSSTVTTQTSSGSFRLGRAESSSRPNTS